MPGDEQDDLIRLAAFQQVRTLNETHTHLTANELSPGFTFQGGRIPLVNPQRGIFKPRQMRFLLSIRTVFPRPGGRGLIKMGRRAQQARRESGSGHCGGGDGWNPVPSAPPASSEATFSAPRRDAQETPVARAFSCRPGNHEPPSNGPFRSLRADFLQTWALCDFGSQVCESCTIKCLPNCGGKARSNPLGTGGVCSNSFSRH